MLKKMGLSNIVIVLSAVILLIPLQSSYAGYDSFTVNVPNAQGGYTALEIQKSGDGYKGPQGEYYSQFPSVAQLQVVYGLGVPNVPVVVNTYVEQPVQQVVTTQVIYQEPPPQDRYEEDADYPVAQINPNEVFAPTSLQEEDNDFIFFKSKKKSKKSKSAAPEAPQAAKPSNPVAPDQKKQTPKTATPSKDWNKDKSKPVTP